MREILTVKELITILLDYNMDALVYTNANGIPTGISLPNVCYSGGDGVTKKESREVIFDIQEEERYNYKCDNKQGEHPSAIRWYDVSLIPQETEELLVECDSKDATWHEIAFYHADTKTFWNGTRQVKNVTRWCYIVDLLEKQKEQKPAGVDEYKIIKKHITEDSLSSEVNKRLTECGWYVTDEKLKEWSEEDKAIIGCIVCCLDGQFVTEAARKQCLEWFNRHRKDFLNQPKQEWSEEDEKKINFLSRLIEFQVKNGEYCFSGGCFISKQEAIEMLKSLRPKHEIHKEKNEKPKHTEVWVEGRTIFEQDANTFVNTEGKPEAKLTGWVARDRDGEICIYKDYPEKDSKGQFWLASGYMPLDQKSFPDLKWEDEPEEVEVTIRKKNAEL